MLISNEENKEAPQAIFFYTTSAGLRHLPFLYYLRAPPPSYFFYTTSAGLPQHKDKKPSVKKKRHAGHASELISPGRNEAEER